MTRRKFSREFKREAVNLVTERGVSIAQAARDLDLHQTVWHEHQCDVSANKLVATAYGSRQIFPRIGR